MRGAGPSWCPCRSSGGLARRCYGGACLWPCRAPGFAPGRRRERRHAADRSRARVQRAGGAGHRSPARPAGPRGPGRHGAGPRQNRGRSPASSVATWRLFHQLPPDLARRARGRRDASVRRRRAGAGGQRRCGFRFGGRFPRDPGTMAVLRDRARRCRHGAVRLFRRAAACRMAGPAAGHGAGGGGHRGRGAASRRRPVSTSAACL
jgi:hypothetical protein